MDRNSVWIKLVGHDLIDFNPVWFAASGGRVLAHSAAMTGVELVR